MICGYARVSTDGQSFDAQVRQLRTAGAGKAFRAKVRDAAATRVIAWQMGQQMERQGITKARLAEMMDTSRAQVDRILKAEGNVTIATLQRAAALVGRELRVELV